MGKQDGRIGVADPALIASDEAQGLRPSGFDPLRGKAEYLLIKRGLYYGPNNSGYTGVRERAGLYYKDDADEMSGVTALHIADAPMFSPACWEDVKVKYLLGIIGDLETALAPFASYMRQMDTFAMIHRGKDLPDSKVLAYSQTEMGTSAALVIGHFRDAQHVMRDKLIPSWSGQYRSKLRDSDTDPKGEDLGLRSSVARAEGIAR